MDESKESQDHFFGYRWYIDRARMQRGAGVCGMGGETGKKPGALCIFMHRQKLWNACSFVKVPV